MRAGVLDRMKRSLDVEESDLFVVNLDQPALAESDLIGLRYFDEFSLSHLLRILITKSKSPQPSLTLMPSDHFPDQRH